MFYNLSKLKFLLKLRHFRVLGQQARGQKSTTILKPEFYYIIYMLFKNCSKL